MARGEVVKINTSALSAALVRRALLRGELAKRAGLSAQTVSSAFAGRPLSLLSARKIARALNTALSSLIERGPLERAIA